MSHEVAVRMSSGAASDRGLPEAGGSASKMTYLAFGSSPQFLDMWAL